MDSLLAWFGESENRRLVEPSYYFSNYLRLGIPSRLVPKIP